MNADAACGNCAAPLQALALDGHYGARIEIDLCPRCHLVWFDDVEPARIAGPGLLALIGAMAQAQALAHEPLGAGKPRCARCGGPVRAVHNRTRWGASLHLQCAERHGAWQTFAQFLGERGLLRPMSRADRARAGAAPGGLHCVNCGGAFGAHDAQCPWCRSVPAVVDVARLARALDPEGATARHAVHATRSRHTALACLACGAAQPADAAWTCPTCGATLAAAGLAEARRQVEPLMAALRDHARKPAPDIVEQRLAAQQPALDRQRDRARQMAAEAEGRAHAGGEGGDPGGDVADWITTRRRKPWLLAAGAALAAWWWWR